MKADISVLSVLLATGLSTIGCHKGLNPRSLAAPTTKPRVPPPVREMFSPVAVSSGYPGLPSAVQGGTVALSTGEKCVFFNRFRGLVTGSSTVWSLDALPQPLDHVHVRPDGVYLVTTQNEIYRSSSCVARLEPVQSVREFHRGLPTHGSVFATDVPLTSLIATGGSYRLITVETDLTTRDITPPGHLGILGFGYAGASTLLALLEGGQPVLSVDGGHHWSDMLHDGNTYVRVASFHRGLFLKTAKGAWIPVDSSGNRGVPVLEDLARQDRSNDLTIEPASRGNMRAWELAKSLMSSRPEFIRAWPGVVRTPRENGSEATLAWVPHPDSGELVVFDESTGERVMTFPSLSSASGCRLSPAGQFVVRTCRNAVEVLHLDGTSEMLDELNTDSGDTTRAFEHGDWVVQFGRCEAAPGAGTDRSVAKSICATEVQTGRRQTVQIEADESIMAESGSRLLISSDQFGAPYWLDILGGVRTAALDDSLLPEPFEVNSELTEDPEEHWRFSAETLGDGTILLRGEPPYVADRPPPRVWALLQDGSTREIAFPSQEDDDSRLGFSPERLHFGTALRGVFLAYDNALFLTNDGGRHWTTLGTMPFPSPSGLGTDGVHCDTEGCDVPTGATMLRVDFRAAPDDFRTTVGSMRPTDTDEETVPQTMQWYPGTNSGLSVARNVTLDCTGIPASARVERDYDVLRSPHVEMNVNGGYVIMDHRRNTAGVMTLVVRASGGDDAGDFTVPSTTVLSSSDEMWFPLGVSRQGVLMIHRKGEDMRLGILGGTLQTPVDSESIMGLLWLAPVPLTTGIMSVAGNQGAILLHLDTLTRDELVVPVGPMMDAAVFSPRWKGGIKPPPPIDSDSVVGFHVQAGGAVSVLSQTASLGSTRWLRTPFDTHVPADEVSAVRPSTVRLCRGSSSSSNMAAWYVRIASLNIESHKYTGLAVIEDTSSPCLRAIRLTAEPGGDTPVPTFVLRADNNTLAGTARNEHGVATGTMRCTIAAPVE